MIASNVSAIGDDARRERNAPSLEPARVAGAVPALVVREHAVGELGIEATSGASTSAPRCGCVAIALALGGRERLVVVDDVEERLVDLPDVVEERDALDGA